MCTIAKVSKSHEWLRSGFDDEVQARPRLLRPAKRSPPPAAPRRVSVRLCEANRLHVIHAPEKLYPSKEEALPDDPVCPFRPGYPPPPHPPTDGPGICQVQKSTKFGDPPHRQWWCLSEV